MMAGEEVRAGVGDPAVTGSAQGDAGDPVRPPERKPVCQARKPAYGFNVWTYCYRPAGHEGRHLWGDGS